MAVQGRLHYIHMCVHSTTRVALSSSSSSSSFGKGQTARNTRPAQEERAARRLLSKLLREDSSSSPAARNPLTPYITRTCSSACFWRAGALGNDKPPPLVEARGQWGPTAHPPPHNGAGRTAAWALMAGTLHCHCTALLYLVFVYYIYTTVLLYSTHPRHGNVHTQ